MKKFLCMLLAMLTLLLLTACGNSSGTAGNTQASAAEKQDAAGKSKILVVYFSCTGNTKALAENAAKALQADVFAIQPEQPYTQNDLNYNDKSTRATVEQNDLNARPKIANKVKAIEKYDTIVVAYPIWWGQEPRIMDTFMESYDFSGKTLAAICTSASSDIGSSDAALAGITGSSAKWKEGHRFTADTSADELGAWFKKIGVE